MGGGGGSGWNSDGTSCAGTTVAGSGGGIVYITARNITLGPSGNINASGGNGGDNTGGDSPLSGSGAGGSIILRALNLSLGADRISAIGGSPSVSNMGTGKRGGVGRIRLDYVGLSG
ncbi:TPA: hypothetical protein HA295_01660, partial [Candidatus Woesearchaeota archaeon]|nr:hypothetical protein [Candidatus Woesearchaeota archaeon]